ncbi:hypothetical protein [Hwanghaeella sp.]|uniref:hypothetical protein n=1 Tax=Hwanghaeella sp. TaxID=2605943 RepID=UPI003CCBCCA3
MVRLRVTFIGFLVICLAAIGTARAELVNADWRVRGDKLLTRDTETGLEWLNIEQTYGRSRAEVKELFGVDQEFEGFRFATLNEFETLLKNAGIPLNFDQADPNDNFLAGTMQDARAAFALTDLMGYAPFLFKYGEPDDNHRRLHGVLKDGFSPILETFEPITFSAGDTRSGLHARLSAALLAEKRTGVDVGMFLVRVAIVSGLPKPARYAWFYNKIR